MMVKVKNNNINDSNVFEIFTVGSRSVNKLLSVELKNGPFKKPKVSFSKTSTKTVTIIPKFTLSIL